MFVARVDLLKQRGNHAGDDAAVLVVGASASHREGLAGPGLPIAHHAPGVTFQCRKHDVFGYQVEHHLLGGVGQHLLELEAPVLLLVVDEALVRRFRDVHVDMAGLEADSTPYFRRSGCSDGRSWRLDVLGSAP